MTQSFGRKFAVAAIILTLSLGAALAAAAELKIGYLDPQRLFTNSKVGKEASKKLQELEAQHRTKLDAKKSEIDKSDAEAQKQFTALSESARASKEEELRKAKIELKRMAEDADRDLSKVEKEYLERIDKEVAGIIKELGKERGYTLILGQVGASILYNDPEIDITDEVIRRYDATQK